MAINKISSILIAGKSGMVGSAIWNRLQKDGYTNLLGPRSSELDLKDQSRVMDYFKKNKIDVVIDAAARVGGILANSQYPYPFLMENLQIQSNLIDAAHRNGVERFLFLGSSCIYPKLAKQPLREDSLLTSSLEPTNQWYAIAKICGVKSCEAIREQYGKDFFSLMPTNLYGPNDNFDLNTSHVLPAMIRKFHDAKINGNSAVKLWGTGTPYREFLHVDDVADAVHFAMTHPMPKHLYNVGSGTDIEIRELAELIQGIVGHTGEIVWDSSKPDGTPRKLMDVSRLANAGWTSKINLEKGIRSTYEWFIRHYNELKEVKMGQG